MYGVFITAIVKGYLNMYVKNLSQVTGDVRFIYSLNIL